MLSHTTENEGDEFVDGKEVVLTDWMQNHSFWI